MRIVRIIATSCTLTRYLTTGNIFGNIEGVDPGQTTPQSDWDSVFYWSESATFNTLEALSLPLQGVFPGSGETPDGVTLSDSAENLVVALPQLTKGQLDSFTKIIVENN